MVASSEQVKNHNDQRVDQGQRGEQSWPSSCQVDPIEYGTAEEGAQLVAHYLARVPAQHFACAPFEHAQCYGIDGNVLVEGRGKRKQISSVIASGENSKSSEEEEKIFAQSLSATAPR